MMFGLHSSSPYSSALRSATRIVSGLISTPVNSASSVSHFSSTYPGRLPISSAWPKVIPDLMMASV